MTWTSGPLSSIPTRDPTRSRSGWSDISFRATDNSGTATLGTPSDSGLAKMAAGSKVIITSDQILDDLVDIER